MRLDEHNQILLSYAELVPAVMSREAYKFAKRKGRFETTCRGGRGRFVEVIFDSMAPRHQSKVCEALGDPREVLGLIPRSAAKPYERVPFNELTPKEMTLCNAKYNLVKCMRQYVDMNGGETGLTAAKAEFVKLVQGGFLCPDSYKIVGRLSAKTLYRWDMEMRKGGDIMDALAPLRAPKRGSELTVAQRKRLTDLYCVESKPTYSEAYRIACRLWRSEGEENIPTEKVCRRFLIDFEMKNGSTVMFLRCGAKKLNDTCLPYIERDPQSVVFMDMLVADGHVLNFDVIHPQTGKPCRPTIIAWQDQRTHLILGFELMVTENTMSVASAFRNACLNAGRILGNEGAVLPRSVYLDNGKAFKNKFFNEQADLEHQIGGLFDRLKSYGLEHVQYARAYNSQTKIIERSWSDFTELERMTASYRGTDVRDKPASLSRNEAWHRNEREKALGRNGMPTLWGAYKLLEWWLGEYNNRISNGKYLKGLSPVELASQQIPDIDFRGRMLQSREMDYMIMHSKTMKLSRNGFRINGVSYYNPIFCDLIPRHEEYIVRYDILNSDRVLVFREDGTFLCEAGLYFGSNIHAMAALGSDADRAKRNRALRQQEAVRKAVIGKAVALRNETASYPELPQITIPQIKEAPAPLMISGESIDTGDNLQIF